MGGEEDIKARLQSPSGLASSSSPSDPDPSVAPRHLPTQRGVTPLRGEPFLRGLRPRESLLTQWGGGRVKRGRRGFTRSRALVGRPALWPPRRGSRPLPANLPQKGLQRQSYGPGMPGPCRTAKNTPAPSQKRRRGVAYPCKIRPAYTAGR